ncbi:nucleotidyltransferase family protein [Thalassospira profundimaris]|uniref:nucleotidyltransferase family protein n=1 Tax=Thalassospira profundimaris TaxID=502049 RepID=UPI000DED3DE4|nr:nucleotidyltransferase family protein [Thalassospira profundimaris]
MKPGSYDIAISPENAATDSDARRFVSMVRKNLHIQVILDRMAHFGLNDWWLTAGCLAQTIWNIQAGYDPTAHIDDYDLFYFDPDTGFEAEDRVIKQVTALFDDVPVRVEMRNQARVPIWYEPKFGFAYGDVYRASDGIDRFAYQTTAIALRQHPTGDFEIYAPFGLEKVLLGRVVPNPVLPVAAIYRQKTDRWRKIWPHLSIQPWPEPASDF